MKHSFKLSKSNIIYAIIVSIIIVLINLRIRGFDSFSFGFIFGSVISVLLIPTLFALLFWFINGRKENGGTTTFNVLLTLMLLGTFSNFVQDSSARQKPIDDLETAISTYKEKALTNPDSTSANYQELSSEVNKTIDEMLKTSYGEERKVFLSLKQYFNKSDAINLEWNNAYTALAEPRILDFTVLDNTEEFNFQKEVVQDYIDKSQNFKMFYQNRISFVKEHTKHFDKDDRSFKGFMKGLKNKDAIQMPILLPYINAHLAYGKDLKGIIALLEQENGKWIFEDEMVIFQNTEVQINYENLLEDAMLNEEIVDEFYDKLIETM